MHRPRFAIFPEKTSGRRNGLEAPRESHRRESLAAPMEIARGVVDSGVPDLASNPEYLKDFGRDTRRHR